MYVMSRGITFLTLQTDITAQMAVKPPDTKWTMYQLGNQVKERRKEPTQSRWESWWNSGLGLSSHIQKPQPELLSLFGATPAPIALLAPLNRRQALVLWGAVSNTTFLCSWIAFLQHPCLTHLHILSFPPSSVRLSFLPSIHLWLTKMWLKVA